jgi:hypothetical protein
MSRYSVRSCGCRQAKRSQRPEAANPGPSPRCCWNRSPCAIKSLCSSGTDLVAHAFASGIGSFGSCSRVCGRNGAIAWSSSSPRQSCAGAVMAGQRFGDIEHAVAGAAGARGFPAKSVILIVRMARENFLWGAPRIHGELLMVGFSVSQATVSRYMPARSRRPGQSWRTFLRNQGMAFRHSEYSENGRVETLAFRVSAIRPGSSDPLHRLRRYGLGSGATSGEQSPPDAIEEFV